MKALNNILLLLAYSLCISAQTTIKPYNIVLIDKQYQVCLDDGQNMKCALSYYNKMDSCLNVAYKQLLSKLDKSSKVTLKKEQSAWLKEEEKEFKAIDQENTIEGRDGEMAIEDEKAKFIKERVLVLINKIETIR
jgi:uncharacterized protein YecT (DUF1311 family)